MLQLGDVEKAESALDNLLSLGPKNIEALSLKAGIYAQRGQYDKEHQMWISVLALDPEDHSALQYVENAWLEEREQFYFTDEVPQGGRRFLAHPRAMIHGSLAGVCGCALYLFLSTLTGKYPLLGNPYVMLLLFVALVLLPWLFIVVAYFQAPREVLLDTQGVSVSTRHKIYRLKWGDLESVYLAHRLMPNASSLTLVFVPKDPNLAVLEVDMSRETSVMKAKTCLVREIHKLFGDVTYTNREHIRIAHRMTIFF